MTKEILKKIVKWVIDNKRKVFGGIIGFIISILVLTIGFLKTLFIVLCTGLGIFLGSKNNSKEKIRELIEKVFSSTKKR